MNETIGHFGFKAELDRVPLAEKTLVVKKLFILLLSVGTLEHRITDWTLEKIYALVLLSLCVHDRLSVKALSTVESFDLVLTETKFAQDF